MLSYSTFPFTHMKLNFLTVWSEVTAGGLPGHLIYAIDLLIIRLF